MAEPIGLASGLLALATFALQCTAALCKTIQSFKSHPKHVRELVEELGALTGVLASITEICNDSAQRDLSALDLPLLRCGKACEEFEQEINRCTARSSAGRTSFRDWAKLRYMGEDIDGFRRQISAYALTINVALTGANLRKSSVTAENLENYRSLIELATGDLEVRLERIDEKLGSLIKEAPTQSGPDASELRKVKEEQLSTQRCLQICARLSEHISQIKLTPESSNPSKPAGSENISEKIINAGLQDCQDNLALTAARLEKHLGDVMNRLLAKSKTALTTEGDVADLERLKDEWDTARQCMEICSKANNHLKENISVIENYATGDAVQFMVSTDGKTIRGINRGLGWRSRQVGGHLNDITVQQLSRDLTAVTIHDTRSQPTIPKTDAPSDTDAREGEKTSDFHDRYGHGFKLPR